MTDLAIEYYGNPPYYRNKLTGLIEKLPNRIRLPDGSTRTDPSQWSNDPMILELSGFEITEVTQRDIDLKAPSIEEKRTALLAALDILWKETAQTGWKTPYGWNLGLDISDVTLLTGAFLLLKEAVSIGLQTTTTIIDTDGSSHEIGLQDLTYLMLSYGQYRSQLSLVYAAIQHQIKSATTITQLEEIILDLSIAQPQEGVNNGST